MDWLLGIKYKVWVISTNEEVKMHLWKNWKHIMSALNPIIDLTNETTFIRTFQSYQFENKWLGFGRMKWNEENNKKWTTKYLSDKTQSKKVNFFSTQIWSPDWNECLNTGESPKLYINLYHNTNINFSKEGILIAIQKKFGDQNEELITRQIMEIRDQIRNSKVSKIVRRWNSGKGYVNRIEHMNPHELEKLIRAGYA